MQCNLQRKQIIHSSIQHVHHNSLNNYSCRDKTQEILIFKRSSSYNQLCRCNVPPNNRPVGSSISQNHYHPRVRNDFQKELGNNRLTHNQMHNKTKPIQDPIGFIRLPNQANIQLGFTGCHPSQSLLGLSGC